MIVFDNSTVLIDEITTPTLFYHSEVEVTGNNAQGIYVSSKVTMSEDSFVSHHDYMFYHCNFNGSYLNTMVPINTALKDFLVSLGAENIFNEGIGYPVSRLDSGNAMYFDKRFSALNDLYLPFSSMNGPDWVTGFDMSYSKDLDFVFFYVCPELRDLLVFSSGDYVGVFNPVSPESLLLNSSYIMRYIAGIMPQDMFIAEELVKITGILDNYDTSGITALFERNDLELRSFLRSVAVTMGNAAGSVLLMKSLFDILKTSDFSPDCFQMDMNKFFTFRIGASLFNYDPSTTTLSFTDQVADIPFYYIDSFNNFNVVRMLTYDDVVLTNDKVYLAYFDLENEELKVDEVSGTLLLDAIQHGLDVLRSVKIVPFMGIRTGAAGEIIKIMFFQTAFVGSETTDVDKYNALLRSYATKSRGSNLITNLENEDTLFILFRDIVDKSFPRDTRLLSFSSDSDNNRIIIDELS